MIATFTQVSHVFQSVLLSFCVTATIVCTLIYIWHLVRRRHTRREQAKAAFETAEKKVADALNAQRAELRERTTELDEAMAQAFDPLFPRDMLCTACRNHFHVDTPRGVIDAQALHDAHDCTRTRQETP